MKKRTNVSEGSLPRDPAAVLPQLLRQQERILGFLQQARGELDTPVAREMVAGIRGEVPPEVEEGFTRLVEGIQSAIQAAQYGESELRRALLTARGRDERELREHLPGGLARFLASREDTPGFSYGTVRDPVRGWGILWKQLTPEGTVRGAGQLWERPYALLDD
jgi:hypothetical protein